MLECPLLLPSADSSGIEFGDLTAVQQWIVTSSYFFATSWVRELINGFIHAAALSPSSGATASLSASSMSQGFSSADIQKKIVARLSSLVELEEELRFTSSKCFVFAPPGLDVLPPPKELFDDDEEPAAASIFDMENDDTNLDSKKAEAKKRAKKRAKKLAKASDKTKAKRLKLRGAHEEKLSSRSMGVSEGAR